ncbi:MAG: hypothetical protein ACRC0V_08450 [Fusobacteriaceae bacterium]
MDCYIQKFREKFNIPENEDIVNLSKYSTEDAMAIESQMKLINKRAAEEGYSNTLISINKGNLYIYKDNISKFDSFLEAKNKDYSDDLGKYEELSDIDYSIEGREHIFSVIDFSEIDDSDEITDSSNLLEWKKNRFELREKLEKAARKAITLNEKVKAAKINVTIKEITKQLEKLDETDPYLVFDSSVREANKITDFLDTALLLSIENNPDVVINMATEIECNQVRQRIEDLETFFTAKDKNTGAVYAYSEIGDAEVKTSAFFFDFSKGLDENKCAEIRDKTIALRHKFDRVQVKIMQGLLLNDSLVKHNFERLTQEQKKEILDDIAKGNIDIDALSMMFLGAKAGGGPLGSILASVRDEQLNKEHGQTLGNLQRLLNAWKEMGTGYDYLKLLRKDRFGVMTNSLISRYSGSFVKKIEDIGKLRGFFYANGQRIEDYKKYMDSLKENFDFIEPQKIKSIIKKYKNNTKIGQYFNVEDNKLDAYEKELRKVLGNTMYEIEVEKVEKQIEEYLDAIDSKIFTDEQADQKNPFEFVNKFYSDNYNTPNPNTTNYYESTFNRYIPKLNKKHLYNENFSDIEKGEKGRAMMDFYKNAYVLINEYANPVLKSEGYGLNFLELATYEDTLQREVTKDLSVLGYTTSFVKDMWSETTKKYFSSDNTEPEKEKKLQIRYSGYGKKEVAAISQIYANKTLKELENIAFQKFGFIPEMEEEEYKEDFKKQLAKSLAQHEINKTISKDIFESIKNTVLLVNEISARRTAIGTLDAIKTYLAVMRKGESENLVDDKNLSNITNFIDVWSSANLYGVRYPKDYKKGAIEGGRSGGFMHKKIPFLGKSRTSAEKELKAILEEEKQNLTDESIYNFVYNDIKYSTKGRDYTKKINGKTVAIEKKEISELYINYLDGRLKSLGQDVTVGSLLMGMLQSIVQKALAFNPRSGFRNRIQGITQNLAVANGERYGFDLNHYNAANRLLRGTNTRKYFLNGQFKNSKRGQAVETLKQFQFGLNLQQNRADDLVVEGDYGGKNMNWLKNAATRVKNFSMDFSVNNPEWHNQSELTVSLMQITMVKDVNGVEHPLYNGETQEFIYKPGTLELREGFDTQDNRDMWVHFKETKDGKKDSIIFIAQTKTAIQQTQGNYASNDIILIQSSQIGKLLTMYMRYFFENTNMQWGTQKYSFQTGEWNVKGRKIYLLGHAPTTMVYLAGSYGMKLVGGLSLLLTGGLASVVMTTAFAVPAVITTILGSTLLYMKKDQIKQMKWSKEEGLLACDFAQEAILLTGRRFASFLSFNNETFKAEKIKEIQQRFAKRNLTEKERQRLSESAQDLASKIFYYSTMSIGALLLQSAYILLFGSADDDEDDTLAERNLKKIIDIEGRINAIINDRNTITEDLDKYFNPSAMTDTAGMLAFYNTVKRSREFFMNPDKWEASGFITNNPFISFPNQIVNTLMNDDKGPLKDARIWSGKDAIDDEIVEILKPTEYNYKESLKIQTRRIRRLATEFYEEKYDNENIKASEYDKKVKKSVSEFMKPMRKGKNETYEKKYKNIDWEKQEERLKNLK